MDRFLGQSDWLDRALNLWRAAGQLRLWGDLMCPFLLRQVARARDLELEADCRPGTPG